MISGFGVVIKNGLGLCRDQLILSMAQSLILQGGLSVVLKNIGIGVVRFYSGIVIIYGVIP